MEILKCEGVRKVYGSKENLVTALDGIDLSVEKGEFVAIVGASGSGKSTFLHICAGLDKANAGHVIIDGTDITKLENKETGLIFCKTSYGYCGYLDASLLHPGLLLLSTQHEQGSSRRSE